MSSKHNKQLSLEWKPDRASKVSLVKQIVGYVKHQVLKGDWLCGDILPPQRTLAKTFEVNRSTVVAALTELSLEGVIESTVGKGTVIANNSWSFLFSSPTPDWGNYIDQGFHKSNLPTIQAINEYEFIEDIIRLSTGEISSSLMPHEAFSTVLSKLAKNPKPYCYMEPLGLYDLRLALCNYLKYLGLDITPKEILIVSGSLQALQLISLSLLGNESKVFVESHSYAKSLNVFDFSGVEMHAVPVDKNGAIPWMINTSSIDGPSILYTIPTFHNPTGITMNLNRRQEVLDWCKNHNFPIIEDDAYGELYFDTPPPAPIKTLDDSGNVLYLGSVSKSIAPGFRIGWIVGPESIIERLGDIKMQTDYGASTLSQWFMTYFINDGHYENHLTVLRQTLKERCQLMLRILEDHFSDIASWNTPAGGFYIWLKFKQPISTKKLFDRALGEKVLINPGYIYGFNENYYVRLSYCYESADTMEKGLRALSVIAHQLMEEL